MKKLLILLCLSTTIIYSSFAQKFGFVDTDFVLKKIPEYQMAQSQIDQISAEWQSEIEKKYQEIDKMYRAYQAEEILLTEEMKKERQDAIFAKEKAVKEFQKKKFGFEGELFVKRQELIKPTQDKVYEAIKKVAKDKQLNFMFDRSSELIMLFADERYNYNEALLSELGITGSEEDSNDGNNKKGTKKTVQPMNKRGR